MSEDNQLTSKCPCSRHKHMTPLEREEKAKRRAKQQQKDREINNLMVELLGTCGYAP